MQINSLVIHFSLHSMLNKNYIDSSNCYFLQECFKFKFTKLYYLSFMVADALSLSLSSLSPSLSPYHSFSSSAYPLYLLTSSLSITLSLFIYLCISLSSNLNLLFLQILLFFTCLSPKYFSLNFPSYKFILLKNIRSKCKIG